MPVPVWPSKDSTSKRNCGVSRPLVNGSPSQGSICKRERLHATIPLAAKARRAGILSVPLLVQMCVGAVVSHEFLSCLLRVGTALFGVLVAENWVTEGIGKMLAGIHCFLPFPCVSEKEGHSAWASGNSRMAVSLEPRHNSVGNAPFPRPQSSCSGSHPTVNAKQLLAPSAAPRGKERSVLWT